MATPIYSPGTYGTGEYYLANNITVAGGTAITLTGAGTTLNLAGCRLKSTNGGIGISITATNNVTVQGGNGSWIDGFNFGINSSTPWMRVQGVIFQNIKHIAANLTGHHSNFVDNVIEGVGGYTLEAYAVGANIGGDDSNVRCNVFRNIYRQPNTSPEWTGEGCPVIINSVAKRCTVELNLMNNDVWQPNTIGVFSGAGGDNIIRMNEIFNFDLGVQGSIATAGAMTVTENTIWMRDAATPTCAIKGNYGSATVNALLGYPTPIIGSIPASGNHIS